MTIPNATKDELEEYRDLERHYAWASQDFEIGMDPEALREALRVLSHYQRENARLARELNDSQSELISTINILTDTRLFAAEKAAEWKSLIADLTAENEEMRSVINAQKGD